jgi:hypothetical protein
MLKECSEQFKTICAVAECVHHFAINKFPVKLFVFVFKGNSTTEAARLHQTAYKYSRRNPIRIPLFEMTRQCTAVVRIENGRFGARGQ